MQPGPFTSFIASLTRVEEKTVAVYVRALREANLLTSGARGVNAPHMLPLDAARVILALLATDRPSECVGLVLRFAAMPYRPSTKTEAPPDYVVRDEPSLEQALVRVIAIDPDSNKLPPSGFPLVEIIRNDKSAKLEFSSGAVAVFRDPGPTSLDDRRDRGGIWRKHSIGTMELALGMWADRFHGVDEQGLPLDWKHPWNEELRGAERNQRHEEITAYLRKRDADWLKGAD